MASLYSYIKNGMTPDGTLPAGFSLPSEDAGGLHFADGAQDGIFIYHVQHEPLSADDIARIGELTALAGAGDSSGAEAGFKDFCKAHRVISFIDDLQRNVMNNYSTLSANAIYKFAVHLLYESDDAECVKVGLSFLEMLDISKDEALKDAVRTIALSDEFTIFAVFIMRKWPDAEAELLSLAKKVRGWGRIHCVEFMDAEQTETKRWLLQNGVDNDVVPAYSAWTVYEKAGVEDILKRDLFTKEEIHALIALTDALMDEGPVQGISLMDSPETYLRRILTITAGRDYLDEYELDILTNIKNSLAQ
ncbi:MAG: hypothetical protein K6F16_01225 [Lachnospiraceae bacterium]|nr:hypothetical protein [Lachnospiraceae bacterium]